MKYLLLVLFVLASSELTRTRLYNPEKEIINQYRRMMYNYNFPLVMIAHLESNNGLNTNHKTILNGLQSGQTAYGTYGILPNTVREYANKVKPGANTALRLIIPKSIRYLELESLSNATDVEIYKYLSNKQNEIELAQLIVCDIMHRQKQDVERLVVAWEKGHNSRYLSSTVVNKSKRVQKVRRLLDFWNRS